LNRQLKSGEQKKSKKTDILRSIGKQSGKCVKSVLEKKRKAIQREGFAKKEGFKPEMKEWG